MGIEHKKPSEVPDFPKVWGITTPTSNREAPVVQLDQGPGGWKFKQATARSEPAYAIVVGGDKYILGPTYIAPTDKFFYVAGYQFNSNVTVKGSTGGQQYLVHVQLGGKVSELEAKEQEHVDDFSHAFEISLKEVADQINNLVSRQFQSRVEAITALIQSLQQSRELVPPDPMDFGSWGSHLIAVLTDLEDMSKDRDTSGSHTPKHWNVICDESVFDHYEGQFLPSATLDPVLGPKGRASQDIVSLRKVKRTYYAGGLLVDPLAVQMPQAGTRVHIKSRTKVNLYSAIEVGQRKASAPGMDFNDCVDWIEVGTECTVVKGDGPGRAWLSLARGTKCNFQDYFDENKGLQAIFFSVALTNI